MSKIKLKKGDTVKVISGESRGKQGKIVTIDPKKLRAIVEGVNMVSKHTKPNTKSPQGGIVKMEAPVHLSNLKIVDNSGKPTRIGRRLDAKTEKLVRYSKKSGEVIK